MQSSLGKDIENQVGGLLTLAEKLRASNQHSEAETIYNQLLNSFPNNPDVYLKLSKLKSEQNDIKSAKNFIREAIKLSSKSIYQLTLAEIYWKEKEFEKSKNITRAELKKHPNDFNIIQNCLMFDLQEANFDKVEADSKKALENKNLSIEQQNILSSFIAICAYLKNDISTLESILPNLESFCSGKMIGSKELISNVLKIYIKFISEIFKWRMSSNSNTTTADKEIYIIGDSHCLSSAHINFKLGNDNFITIPKLIIGTKAWHLSDKSEDPTKHSFKKILATIPKGSKVIMNFGEIDCRPNEGIFAYSQKNPSANIEENIKSLVTEYVKFTSKIANKNNLEVLYTSVPAPKYSYIKNFLDDEKIKLFATIIPLFNKYLLENTQEKYLNTYTRTLADSGFAKDNVHIDDVHLKPNILVEALQEKFI